MWVPGMFSIDPHFMPNAEEPLTLVLESPSYISQTHCTGMVRSALVRDKVLMKYVSDVDFKICTSNLLLCDVIYVQPL